MDLQSRRPLATVRGLILAVLILVGMVAVLPTILSVVGASVPYQVVDGSQEAPRLEVAADSRLGRAVEMVPGLARIVVAIWDQQWSVPHTGIRIPWFGIILIGVFVVVYRSWPKRYEPRPRHLARLRWQQRRERERLRIANEREYIDSLCRVVQDEFPEGSSWRQAFVSRRV
jgi:hypothetical protein